MDKLEKALQKARQERAGVQTPVVSGGQSLKSSARAPVSVPSGEVTLSPQVLEKNKIVGHLSKDPQADVFRLLRTQVLQVMAKHGFKTLAVTSPNYGDGKTTIAINLGLSIALDVNQTVLLADLDLRKPSAHRYLGLEPTYGLTDYLAGRADIASCLLRLPCERMSLMPAGESLDQSSEMLNSPKMGALADELKARYADRMIIYDMPPLLAQDDPLAFLPHVDAVLLVLRDAVTPVQDVKRSLDILSSATVIGTVLNDKLGLMPV